MKKRQLVLLILVVYLVGVAGYAAYSYKKEKDALLAETDRALLAAAQSIPRLVEPSFHQGLDSSATRSDDQLRDFAIGLTNVAKVANVAFLHSLFSQDGQIFFVASNIVDETDWKSEKWKSFLIPYKEPPSELVQSMADGKVRFAEYTDEFGSFRSVFMPWRAPKQALWVSGADMNLEGMNSALRRKMFDIGVVALYFLLMVAPMALIYIRILQKDKELLEEAVTQRTAELSTLNAELGVLSNKLSKYLSPQIYESIFTGKQDVQVASRRKPLTVFFSDIKDFTSTTDALEPEALTGHLNSYLTAMAQIALKHGATIDKYIGDAIMALFENADDALRASLAMLESLDRFNAQRRPAGLGHSPSKPASRPRRDGERGTPASHCGQLSGGAARRG